MGLFAFVITCCVIKYSFERTINQQICNRNGTILSCLFQCFDENESECVFLSDDCSKSTFNEDECDSVYVTSLVHETDLLKCFGKLSTDTDVCNSRGECVEDDRCSCFGFYLGDECESDYISYLLFENMKNSLWLVILLVLIVAISIVLITVYLCLICSHKNLQKVVEKIRQKRERVRKYHEIYLFLDELGAKLSHRRTSNQEMLKEVEQFFLKKYTAFTEYDEKQCLKKVSNTFVHILWSICMEIVIQCQGLQIEKTKELDGRISKCGRRKLVPIGVVEDIAKFIEEDFSEVATSLECENCDELLTRLCTLRITLMELTMKLYGVGEAVLKEYEAGVRKKKSIKRALLVERVDCVRRLKKLVLKRREKENELKVIRGLLVRIERRKMKRIRELQGTSGSLEEELSDEEVGKLSQFISKQNGFSDLQEALSVRTIVVQMRSVQLEEDWKLFKKRFASVVDENKADDWTIKRRQQLMDKYNSIRRIDIKRITIQAKSMLKILEVQRNELLQCECEEIIGKIINSVNENQDAECSYWSRGLLALLHENYFELECPMNCLMKFTKVLSSILEMNENNVRMIHQQVRICHILCQMVYFRQQENKMKMNSEEKVLVVDLLSSIKSKFVHENMIVIEARNAFETLLLVSDTRKFIIEFASSISISEPFKLLVLLKDVIKRIQRPISFFNPSSYYIEYLCLNLFHLLNECEGVEKILHYSSSNGALQLSRVELLEKISVNLLANQRIAACVPSTLVIGSPLEIISSGMSLLEILAKLEHGDSSAIAIRPANVKRNQIVPAGVKKSEEEITIDETLMPEDRLSISGEPLADEVKGEGAQLDSLHVRCEQCFLFRCWNELNSMIRKGYESNSVLASSLEGLSRILSSRKSGNVDWSVLTREHEGDEFAISKVLDAQLRSDQFYLYFKYLNKVLLNAQFLQLKLPLATTQYTTFDESDENTCENYLYPLLRKEKAVIVSSAGGGGKSCLTIHCISKLYGDDYVFGFFIRGNVFASKHKNWKKASLEGRVSILIESIIESNASRFHEEFSVTDLIEFRLQVKEIFGRKLPVVIVFDSFDEVPALTRSMFTLMVGELQNMDERDNISISSIILSTRPEILEDSNWSSFVSGFKTVVIDPMPLKNLLKLVRELLIHNDKSEEVDMISERFSGILASKSESPLIGVLLLLRLLSTDSSHDEEIKRNSFKLYNDLIIGSLKFDQKKFKSVEDSVANCSTTYLMSLLSIIGYVLQTYTQNTKDRPTKDLIAFIFSQHFDLILGNEQWLSSLKNPVISIIKSLTSTTSVLSENKQYLIFSHQTIQEFFCSRFLCNPDLSNMIDKLFERFQKSNDLCWRFRNELNKEMKNTFRFYFHHKTRGIASSMRDYIEQLKFQLKRENVAIKRERSDGMTFVESQNFERLESMFREFFNECVKMSSLLGEDFVSNMGLQTWRRDDLNYLFHYIPHLFFDIYPKSVVDYVFSNQFLNLKAPIRWIWENSSFHAAHPITQLDRGFVYVGDFKGGLLVDKKGDSMVLYNIDQENKLQKLISKEELSKQFFNGDKKILMHLLGAPVHMRRNYDEQKIVFVKNSDFLAIITVRKSGKSSRMLVDMKKKGVVFELPKLPSDREKISNVVLCEISKLRAEIIMISFYNYAEVLIISGSSGSYSARGTIHVPCFRTTYPTYMWCYMVGVSVGFAFCSPIGYVTAQFGSPHKVLHEENFNIDQNRKLENGKMANNNFDFLPRHSMFHFREKFLLDGGIVSVFREFSFSKERSYEKEFRYDMMRTFGSNWNDYEVQEVNFGDGWKIVFVKNPTSVDASFKVRFFDALSPGEEMKVVKSFEILQSPCMISPSWQEEKDGGNDGTLYEYYAKFDSFNNWPGNRRKGPVLGVYKRSSNKLLNLIHLDYSSKMNSADVRWESHVHEISTRTDTQMFVSKRTDSSFPKAKTTLTLCSSVFHYIDELNRWVEIQFPSRDIKNSCDEPYIICIHEDSWCFALESIGEKIVVDRNLTRCFEISAFLVVIMGESVYAMRYDTEANEHGECGTKFMPCPNTSIWRLPKECTGILSRETFLQVFTQFGGLEGFVIANFQEVPGSTQRFSNLQCSVEIVVRNPYTMDDVVNDRRNKITFDCVHTSTFETPIGKSEFQPERIPCFMWVGDGEQASFYFLFDKKLFQMSFKLEKRDETKEVTRTKDGVAFEDVLFASSYTSRFLLLGIGKETKLMLFDMQKEVLLPTGRRFPSTLCNHFHSDFFLANGFAFLKKAAYEKRIQKMHVKRGKNDARHSIDLSAVNLRSDRCMYADCLCPNLFDAADINIEHNALLVCSNPITIVNKHNFNGELVEFDYIKYRSYVNSTRTHVFIHPTDYEEWWLKKINPEKVLKEQTVAIEKLEETLREQNDRNLKQFQEMNETVGKLANNIVSLLKSKNAGESEITEKQA